MNENQFGAQLHQIGLIGFEVFGALNALLPLICVNLGAK
jgi:hypothetical protein